MAAVVLAPDFKSIYSASEEKEIILDSTGFTVDEDECCHYYQTRSETSGDLKNDL